jgi:putative transposase
MPRPPRLFLAGVPVHIVQRGHNRRCVFRRLDDYGVYLSNLAEARSDLAVRVLAYCLMTNHVHLVVVPGDEPTNVSRFMRILAARQTRYVNRLEQRTGTLWEGRFKASLIDSERYLLACCRYTELNPVRAGMVTAPEDYPWSSYRGRAGFTADPVLDEHDALRAFGQCPEARVRAYRAFVAAGSTVNELSLIRSALQRNQLTGDTAFRQVIERQTGQQIGSRGPGRPSGKSKKDTSKNKSDTF